MNSLFSTLWLSTLMQISRHLGRHGCVMTPGRTESWLWNLSLYADMLSNPTNKPFIPLSG